MERIKKKVIIMLFFKFFIYRMNLVYSITQK